LQNASCMVSSETEVISYTLNSMCSAAAGPFLARVDRVLHEGGRLP
jgi:hypothetical protein